eukprot:754227-Pyramimonas_sp.AAC.1
MWCPSALVAQGSPTELCHEAEASAPTDTQAEEQRKGIMHDLGIWAVTWTVYIDLDEARNQANWKM